MSKVFIKNDGTTVGVHSSFMEDLRHTLGKSFIRRVSNVEYDNVKKQWFSKLFSSNEIQFFNSRQLAIDWETGKLEEGFRNGAT